MSDIRIVRDYPRTPAKVWRGHRSIAGPAMVGHGQGGRPVGFSAAVGTHFQLVGKPVIGWRGIVDCEVLEAREPSLLRYSWIGGEGEKPSYVTYRIEPLDGGTRFIFEHTGFTGPAGYFMAKLLSRVRTKMLTVGLPAGLDDLDDNGVLHASSNLRATPLS